jgi:small-conductance mechanosensitive channel
MDVLCLILTIFLTRSSILYWSSKFLCLGSKIIKIIILILNALRAALSVSYSAQCAFRTWRELLYFIMKAGFVALGAYMIKYSSTRHILNAHWATPHTFCMHIEQHLVPSWCRWSNIKVRQNGHRNKGLMLMFLPDYFECA